MMRITYYALRTLAVNGEPREPGDLVPEAAYWPYLSGYIQDGKIAPVLVASLPEDAQVFLMEWEDEQVSGTKAPEPKDAATKADDTTKKKVDA